MKKMTAILLCLLMILMLAACGEDQPGETLPNQGNQQTEPVAGESTGTTQESQPATGETGDTQASEPEQTEQQPGADVFTFTYKGVQLVTGAAFDASAVPTPDSIYEIPSCAFEGNDTVYSYNELEMTLYGTPGQQVIYSVFILDVNTPTAEGLYMGDTKAQAIAIYGSGYTENSTEWVYTKGNTTLRLLFQGDTIISIEYRMA